MVGWTIREADRFSQTIILQSCRTIKSHVEGAARSDSRHGNLPEQPSVGLCRRRSRTTRSYAKCYDNWATYYSGG